MDRFNAEAAMFEERNRVNSNHLLSMGGVTCTRQMADKKAPTLCGRKLRTKRNGTRDPPGDLKAFGNDGSSRKEFSWRANTT
ncbi:unnamed protein product, partial [Iphiclides podalirius]